jgi:hypothetical protein
MTLAGLRRVDRRRLSMARDEIVCVACARNEHPRLAHFLAYYRQLGIHRFLIVDNASDDGTSDALMAEPDVHLFYTDESYSASAHGVSWMNALLASFATGHWALTVDLDELLVYPDVERVGLSRLASYLERRQEQAVPSFLLDMYGERPIEETICTPGTPFLDVCPYFDRDSYEWEPGPHGPVPARGGPRQRVFWALGAPPRPAPFLPKIPFVKWRADLAYVTSTHLLESVRTSELSSVLLHFKFFADFGRRAAEETERREHWQQAGQYAVYDRVMRERPRLQLMYAGSVRYENSRQLVALGLMRAPADFPVSAA